MDSSQGPESLAIYWVNEDGHTIGPDIDAMRRAVAGLTGRPYGHRQLREGVEAINDRRIGWIASQRRWAAALAKQWRRQRKWSQKVAKVATRKDELLDALRLRLPEPLVGAAAEVVAKARREYESRSFDFYPRRTRQGWRRRKLRRDSTRWQMEFGRSPGYDALIRLGLRQDWNRFDGPSAWLEHIAHDENGDALTLFDELCQGEMPFIDYATAIGEDIETILADYVLGDIADGWLRLAVSERLAGALSIVCYSLIRRARAADLRMQRRAQRSE